MNLLKNLYHSTFKFNYRLHEIYKTDKSPFLTDFFYFVFLLLITDYAWFIARIPNAYFQINQDAAIRETLFLVIRFLSYDVIPFIILVIGTHIFLKPKNKLKTLSIALSAWTGPAFLRIFLNGIPSIFPNISFYPIPFFEIPQLLAYISGILNLYTIFKYSSNDTGFDKLEPSSSKMYISWIIILTGASAIMFWMPIYKAIPMFIEAPDFILPSLDGNTCKLSNYRGKTVVLEMWSTRCPHCRREAKELEKLSKILDPDKYAIVSVHVWGGKTAIPQIKQSFTTHKNIKICLDDGKVWRKYKKLPKHIRPAGIPHIMLLDKYGIIQKVMRGYRSVTSLKSQLQKVTR